MKTATTISSATAVVLALLAYRFRMALMTSAFPDRMWRSLLPSSVVNCPVMKPEDLTDKLVRVPTIKVSSHEECIAHGRALGKALLCTGIPLDVESAANSLAADPTPYQVQCYDDKALKSTTIFSPPTLNNMTLAEVLANPSCYAGFIYGDTHQQQLAEIFPHMDALGPHSKDVGDDFHFGTSFMSNFTKPTLSAPDHAALVESVVYQLVGKKVFMVYDRLETSTNSYYWNGGTFQVYPMCGRDFFHNIKNIWVTTVEAGQYLYFPFTWNHIVYTDEGTNVMTNVRFTSKSTIRTQLSLDNLLGVIGRRLLKPFKLAQGSPRFHDFTREFAHTAYRSYNDVANTNVVMDVLDKYL